jgi:hypothetical protein
MRNDQSPTSDDTGAIPPVGALLRLAADDELTPEQARALDAHLEAHPQDRERIAFERALRQRVAAAMNTGAAPAGLREHIAHAFREAHAHPDQRPGASTGPIDRSKRNYWRDRPVWALAIAAALLVAATAYMVIQPFGGVSATGWLDGASTASLVSFVEREHSRCADMSDDENPKFVARSLDDGRQIIADRLGVTPDRLDIMGCGYMFAGLGPCKVPGSGKSVHLLYRPTKSDGPAISLFVQRDAADMGRDRDSICVSKLSTLGEVLIWRDAGLIYYLVCPTGTNTQDALKALGGPATRRSI